MDPDFWQRVWREGRTAFHEGKPNYFLERYTQAWPAGRRVLVPLAGKTADMAALAAMGHQVVGVELSELGARAFFDERGLVAQESREGDFLVLETEDLSLWVGDFFATSTALLGRFDAVYDRAALIALPPELRARYVPHVRSLLAPSFEGLLVTFEYPAGALEAPPFSVEEEEVRRLWGGARVEELEYRPSDAMRARAAAAPVHERCYRLSAGA